MERGALTRRARALAAAGVIGVVAVAAAVIGVSRLRSDGEARPIPASIPRDARAPEGVRIRVQVVNATTTRGLARRATLLLRDLGYDVVEMGTSRETRDSTIVFDRSGHPEWARGVARALGARSEARPDSSRYLDVTAVIGADWRPPAEPFHP